MDDLELAQGTAYSYVNRLVDAGVVDVIDDEQPHRYAACEIDLTVTTAVGDREYTITPAVIDADVVTPVPEDQFLVHEPSSTVFDFSTQLAVFHRGWTAGRDADAEGE